jgi:uncharacterized coiled-coil DUF342 family protein
MAREPIKNTCPIIDKYIQTIKGEIVDTRYLDGMDVDELREIISSMSSQLNECIDYLEEMRTANSVLRGWGNDEASRADEAENKVYELEDKISELEVKIEDLEYYIEALEKLEE